MNRSIEKFQESLALIRQGMDLMVEAAPALLQQQAKAEVTMNSLETFMGETRRRLTSLEEKEKERDMRLAALEKNLSKALISLFPRVESILSDLERKNQESEKASISDFVKKKSSVASTSKEIPNCSQTSSDPRVESVLTEPERKNQKSTPVNINDFSRKEGPDASTSKEVPNSSQTSGASASSSEAAASPPLTLDRELITATNSGNLLKVKRLIATGVNINAKSLSGKSALSIAAVNGHLECLQELINAGADKFATDADGYNAVHLAASRGKDVILQYLLTKGIDVDIETDSGETPLSLASKHGHKKCLLILLEHFADIDPKDDDDRTPLHYAVMNNNVECVIVLLEWGADLYTLDCDGKSSLYYAFQSQNRAMHDAILSITDSGND